MQAKSMRSKSTTRLMALVFCLAAICCLLQPIVGKPAKKPQDSVNAEDLETLQNELESRLVHIVAQKWELEREFDALCSTSPDSATNPANSHLDETIAKQHSTVNTASSTQSSNYPTGGSGLPSGKLRNSIKQSLNDPDLMSDGFKGSLATNSGSNGGSGSISGATSNETDSVSSESSLVSTLTGSTIITAALADSGSQATNSSSNKRSSKNQSNERPSKRFRQDSSNSVRSTGPTFSKRPPHCKHRPKVVPSKYRNSLEESRPSKQQLVKNEAPDKLWPFVEQFCVTPTEEQMKELEEMIKAIDNDKEFYKVPSPGKKDPPSNKDTPSKNDTPNSKSRKSKNEDETHLGALTQRLVSSFIDEVDDAGTDDVSKSSSDVSPPPAKKKKSRANKGIDLNDAKKWENTIRQQLEEYSILSQQDEIPYTSEEDDVLRQLIAYKHELNTVQAHSRLYMQLLLKRAKRHLQLENEREKLREANADVIAAYVRLIQAKQRKRNPTKKEKDSACKALKVHDAVFKKCDDLYMSSLNRNNTSST